MLTNYEDIVDVEQFKVLLELANSAKLSDLSAAILFYETDSEIGSHLMWLSNEDRQILKNLCSKAYSKALERYLVYTFKGQAIPDKTSLAYKEAWNETVKIILEN